MVTRVGISLDQDLLDQFDRLIEKRGWPNRSEAVRDLIRDALVQDEWEDDDKETVAAVVLVYDHHAQDLQHKLHEIQHRSHASVVSTLHVHLDAHNCLEVVILRGKTSEIRHMGDALIGARGVRHGKFVGSTSGDRLR